MLQHVWVEEFERLEQRAERAETEATRNRQRADAHDAALREAHRQLDELRTRIAEILRELNVLRLRERVLVEALEDSGIEPNGWVDERMAEIQAQEGDPDGS